MLRTQKPPPFARGTGHVPYGASYRCWGAPCGGAWVATWSALFLFAQIKERASVKQNSGPIFYYNPLLTAAPAPPAAAIPVVLSFLHASRWIFACSPPEKSYAENAGGKNRTLLSVRLFFYKFPPASCLFRKCWYNYVLNV